MMAPKPRSIPEKHGLVASKEARLQLCSQDWQHPFVNVFKLCEVDKWSNVDKSGQVYHKMDRGIGKQVVVVSGAIPAVNFLTVPKSVPLNLNGRFCYIQIRVEAQKLFAVHIEASTMNSNINRVSIDNIFKEGTTKRRALSVHLPGHAIPPNRWTTVVVDMVEALKPVSRSPYHAMRSFQVCANLEVRGIFTSDIKFGLESLPREMILSHAISPLDQSLVWLPAEPQDVKEFHCVKPVLAKKERTSQDLRAQQDTEVKEKRTRPASAKGAPRGPGCRSSAIQEAHEESTQQRVVTSLSPEEANQETEMTSTSQTGGQSIQGTQTRSEATALPEGARDQAGKVEHLPSCHGENKATKRIPWVGGGAMSVKHKKMVVGAPMPMAKVLPGQTNAKCSHAPGLEPDPYLSVSHVLGYTGEFTRNMLWIPASEEVVWGCANLVIAMAVNEPHRQRCFSGHTSYVCTLALSPDGRTMVTGQEGKQATIRIWDVASGDCLALLCAHAGGLVGLDVSPHGGALIAVGQDPVGRQLMVVWDITSVRTNGQVPVMAQQVTDYNVRCVRFSPFEEQRFMTCGRDSVRTYRLKGGEIRGMSVKMNPADKRALSDPALSAVLSGPKIFTDLAYESGPGVYQLEQCHVYVASATGAVFQVNYHTRTLVAVYQLHVAAINSLLVHDGFCVTASDDRFLRLWPLDFTDFLMEAEHEAGVTAVGLSPEGLRVCVGTESGLLGVMDIATHQYSSLLRSHMGLITSVTPHPTRPEFCTTSADGTIRVWHQVHHQQLYEFVTPGEVVESAAYHPSGNHLACGFANGKLRVFDLERTSLVQEQHQHRGGIQQLAFSIDGAYLFSGSVDGRLCVYDVDRDYLPVKFLPAGAPGEQVCLAVSPKGDLLATTTYSAQRLVSSIVLFDLKTMQPSRRMGAELSAYRQLVFSSNGQELWALAQGNQLQRLSVADGVVLQDLTQEQPGDTLSLALALDMSFLALGGTDGMVRLLEYVPRDKLQDLNQLPGYQNFIAHPGEIRGMTVMGQHLFTVGEGGMIISWDIHGPRKATDDTQLAVDALDLQDTEQEIEVQGGDHSLQPGTSGSQLVGFNGQCRQTLAWWREAGMLVYAVENLVVMDELGKGKQTHLQHHREKVCCLSLSPDRHLLATASEKPEVSNYTEICIWALPSRHKLHILLHYRVAVELMRFSPDSNWLVSLDGGRSPTLMVWDMATGSAVASLTSEDPIMDLCWHCGLGDRVFLTAGKGGLAHWTWGPQGDLVRSPIQIPQVLTRELTAVASTGEEIVSPEVTPSDAWPPSHSGRGPPLVAVADTSGSVWQAEVDAGDLWRGCLVGEVTGQKVTKIVMNDEKIVVGTDKGELHTFHPPGSDTSASSEPLHLDGPVQMLVLEPSAMTEGVASTSSCTLWHVNLVEPSRIPMVWGMREVLSGLAVSGDGEALHLVTTSRGGAVHQWKSGQHQVSPGAQMTTPSSCSSLVLAQPGPSLVILGHEDGSMRGLDSTSWTCTWHTRPHTSSVVSLVQLQDRPLIVSAGRKGMIQVVHLTSGQPHLTIDQFDRQLTPLHSLAVSGDTQWCALAWLDRFLIASCTWEEADLQVQTTYTCPEVPADLPVGSCSRLSFLPAAPQLILFCSPCLLDKVILYHHQQQSVITTFQFPSVIHCISPSLDGCLLAAGGADGGVYVRTLEDEEVVVCHGATSPVHHVCWSHDGHMLLAGHEKSVMLWQR